MTTAAAPSRDARVAGTLAAAVLAGAVFRVLVAVAAGIAEWAEAGPGYFGRGRDRAADLLIIFGSPGDGVGVLLVIAAMGLLWWRWRAGGGVNMSALGLVRLLFALTALAAVLQLIGYGLAISQESSVLWARFIEAVGMSTAFAGIAVGGVIATGGLVAAVDADEVGSDLDAVVFAVDRATGDVHAYFSVDQAARKTHVYSVEDQEIEFFTDEGGVLQATVEHDRVVLRRTDEQRRGELLGCLKRFATRRELHVDVLDVDDPSAYAVPISDWQFLQLWPGWLRWLGRLFRPS